MGLTDKAHIPIHARHPSTAYLNPSSRITPCLDKTASTGCCSSHAFSFPSNLSNVHIPHIHPSKLLPRITNQVDSNRKRLIELTIVTSLGRTLKIFPTHPVIRFEPASIQPIESAARLIESSIIEAWMNLPASNCLSIYIICLRIGRTVCGPTIILSGGQTATNTASVWQRMQWRGIDCWDILVYGCLAAFQLNSHPHMRILVFIV